MNIKIKAVAGTLESSDILIIVEPNSSEIEIELESEVMAQFGKSIKKVILDTCEELGVKQAKITVTDKGAIDAVIKSRVQTAIFRAAEIKNFNDFNN